MIWILLLTTLTVSDTVHDTTFRTYDTKEACVEAWKKSVELNPKIDAVCFRAVEDDEFQ